MVRKVEYALRLKGLAYDRDTAGIYRWRSKVLEHNPLGQIPALSHGDFSIAGSSIICAYLEHLEPEPELVPSDLDAAARNDWLVSLADGPMWDHVRSIWLALIVGPLEGRQPDDEALEYVTEGRTGLVGYYDELERHLSAPNAIGKGPFIVDARLRLADLALAALITSMAHAGEVIDAARWPRLAVYEQTLLAVPVIAELFAETTEQVRVK